MSSIPISLRRRFLRHNLLLVGGLIVAGAVTVWRLGLLRHEVDLSHNVYAELRIVGNVGVEVGIVRGLLTNPEANHGEILTRLANAQGGLQQFIDVGKGYSGASDMEAAYVPINQSADAARVKLQSLLDQLTRDTEPVDANAARAAIDEVMRDLDRVGSSCITFMRARQETASATLLSDLLLIGGMSLAAVIAAVMLSILQHRQVVAPLMRLRTGVRRMGAARFAERLDLAHICSSNEFLDLATDFNQMAEELDGFYRRLEEQVRTKSAELVRSERLASVGFLASGLAHEINNPLNIISGYAELTVRQMEPSRGPLDLSESEQVREGLRIIRDEAFRCKQITEKLLSLSRSGGDARESLDLSGVARDVAALTKGLKPYRDRRLTIKLDPIERLEVEANATEMKQVLLNLTINALEAVPPGSGEVCIEGRRNREWVELSVSDNGRGMDADVLRHVFEPFFTTRRGSGDSSERGTGLGLSITHAIVENHGGRIHAESGGIGRGSRFTVRLPSRQIIGDGRTAGTREATAS